MVDLGANSASISSASVFDAAGAGAGTEGAGAGFFSAAGAGAAVVESSFFPMLKLGAAAALPAIPPPILRLAAALGLSPPILKLGAALAPPPPILKLAGAFAPPPPIDKEGAPAALTGGPGVKLGGVKPFTERGS